MDKGPPVGCDTCLNNDLVSDMCKASGREDAPNVVLSRQLPLDNWSHCWTEPMRKVGPRVCRCECRCGRYHAKHGGIPSPQRRDQGNDGRPSRWTLRPLDRVSAAIEGTAERF
jgi:hypothetical protein